MINSEKPHRITGNEEEMPDMPERENDLTTLAGKVVQRKRKDMTKRVLDAELI